MNVDTTDTVGIWVCKNGDNQENDLDDLLNRVEYFQIVVFLPYMPHVLEINNWMIQKRHSSSKAREQ